VRKKRGKRNKTSKLIPFSVLFVCECSKSEPDFDKLGRMGESISLKGAWTIETHEFDPHTITHLAEICARSKVATLGNIKRLPQ
jgi:hypothetical protein